MSHRPLPFLTHFLVVIPTAVNGVCEFSVYHDYFLITTGKSDTR